MKRESPKGKPKVSLSLRKKIAFTFLANFCVLGLLAGLGELACRVFSPQTQYESMQELAMPLHRFSDDMYMGFELREGVAGHNSAGFRGPEVSRQKPAGTWRIAVIGDSVTYGLGVPQEQTFCAGLQSRLRAAGSGPVEVLNFGVPAYSSFQEYRLLRSRVLDFQPDLVVWVFSSDDTETSPILLNIGGRMCLFRNQFEGIGLFNNPVHWTVFRHSHLYRFLYRQAVLAFAAPRGRFDDVYRQPDVAWRNVLRAASLCRERGVAFLLVLSPMLEPFYYPTDPSDPGLLAAPEMLMEPAEAQATGEAFDRIRLLARRSPLPRHSHLETVDLGTLYHKEGAKMKLQATDHEHLGPVGHRLVAELLAEKVLALKPVNP